MHGHKPIKSKAVLLMKAQASMEYLMTYGWAILVILIILGGLAYFGVLNPQKLLPERCELQLGLRCKDYRVSAASNSISLAVENGRGTDIMLVDVGAFSQELGVKCQNTTLLNMQTGNKFGMFLQNGASVSVIIPCQGADPLGAGIVGTGKRKWDLNMTWYDFGSTSAYSHTATGQLISVVEP